eukprot:765339-Hanusia_phi.AAC.2
MLGCCPSRPQLVRSQLGREDEKQFQLREFFSPRLRVRRQRCFILNDEQGSSSEQKPWCFHPSTLQPALPAPHPQALTDMVVVEGIQEI